MTSPTTELERVLDGLRQPARLFTLDDLRGPASRAPRVRGIYAWYFRRRPPGVPPADHRLRDMELLYVGIGSSLKRRFSWHGGNDASKSTLRRSIGSLLGLVKRPKGSSYWFADDEETVSVWLCNNAMACWVESHLALELEPRLIGELRPHLNLKHNRSGAFYPFLSAARALHREGCAHDG